jgi:RNA polymerase sigma factor (sigma-70 family)
MCSPPDPRLASPGLRHRSVPVQAPLGRRDTYEQNRDYVLSVLGRRCRWLDVDDREAALHDAYAVLLEKEREGRLDTTAMHPNQLRAYFTQTAINKALDEGKRADRRRTEPLDEPASAEPDPGRAPEELVSASLDSARMREIVGELPERAQTIVKLRFYFDRTPTEIQGFLGISERAYRRELERAMRRVAETYRLVREDSFCDSRRSLILAYVAGIAGPGRTAKAREHLATCPGCSHWATELRIAAERAAAVLPLPPLVLDGGPMGRLAESLAGLRDGLANASGAAKQHAGALSARLDAAMPQYVSGARPGAVAAALVGCVAIGSGATYCALEGLPGPVGSHARVEAKAAKSEKAKAREPRARPGNELATTSTKRLPVVPRAEPEPRPEPARNAQRGRAPTPARPSAAPPSAAPASTAPPPPASASVAPPAPPPLPEFGFEQGQSAGGGGVSSAPPAAPSPPPAPPGEFDP